MHEPFIIVGSCRAGMSSKGILPFVAALLGRELSQWEMDAIETAERQAAEKRIIESRASIDMALQFPIIEPPPLLTYPHLGPGLGEPGRIASALRRERRRKRNKAAAESRRRNRK